MGDQPGAGGSRSYKIRGYTRERQSAKPYARPPGRRKGVIETVKDFFSPSWLVDLFKGNTKSQAADTEAVYVEEENNQVSETVEESSSSHSNGRSSSIPSEVSATSKVGNGQLRSSFGPGYFSSILRQREVSGDIASTSRPSRTFGLSSGFDGSGEPSTSSPRSEELDSEVPISRGEDENVQLDPVVEEDVTEVHDDRQQMMKPEGLLTSTPALFLSAGRTRRANTSIFGQPVSMTEASTSRSTTTSRPHLFMPSSESRPEKDTNISLFGEPLCATETSTSKTANTSRPQLFTSSTESRAGPQPFSFAKNRPSFSVSAFGSPLPPKEPQAGGFSSPFYRGKTKFGGASSMHSSAHKRLRKSSPTLGEATQPVRKVITPKPVSSVGSSGVTSQTAKRILEALESMSSPLIDARKIPTPPISPSASPLSFSPAQRKRPPIPSRAVGSPRSLKARFPGPPVQDLSAPQQASVSRLKPKETASRETTAISSSSLFSTAMTTIPTFSKPSVSSFTPTPLPISLSPSSSDTKAGGKVKSARSRAHYSQRDRADDKSEDEVVNPIPEVKAAVPLTLANGKSLPSFSFTPTGQSRMTNSPASEMSLTAHSTAKVDLTKNNFKFSKPAEKVPVLAQESSTTDQTSVNKITFSFSQPLSKSNAMSDKKSVDMQDSGFAVEVKQTEKAVEPNNNLLNKFAPLPGSWTCDTCLVSNKSTDTKCVACQASKPSTGKPAAKRRAPTSTNNDLMVKFAPPAGSWSCDERMVSNDASKTKCDACQSPKPSAEPPVLSSRPAVNVDNDLMKKFAPAADEWSCDTCLLQNKLTDNSCVACKSPKPGAANVTKTTAITFGVSSKVVSENSLEAMFAPPLGSWTCDTCMINNKEEDSTCAACGALKPGGKPGAAISSHGFAFSGGQSFSSSPFKFGINSSGPNVSSTSLSKFGEESNSTGESSSVAVTFGFTGKDQSKNSNSNLADSSNKLPASFTFGAPASQTVAEAGENKPNASMPFTFVKPTVNHIGEDDSVKAPGFSFVVESSSDMAKSSTAGIMHGTTQVTTSLVIDKPNSTAAAAAAASGFLKVPEVKEVAKSTTEKATAQTGAGMSIADAAKSGFLTVPTVGEKKESGNPHPNVNVFASSQSASTTMPETGAAFSFTASSGAPSPFQFGAATTSSSATTGAFGQVLGAVVSSNAPFQFAAVATSATTPSSQATSTMTPAPSAFSLPTNATAPVKITAAAPFPFMANVAAPATTPAPTFSFSASTASTASTGTVGETFQFSASSTVNKPTVPNASVPVFQFGVPDASSVTSSNNQPAQQTFRLTTPAATASSDTVKPFGFNIGSAGQGFSFAAPKPDEASTGQPATFAFGGLGAKPDASFPAFGAPQPSSSQQAATTFMFGASTNSTPAASEETMEADGSNSSTNLFASSGNTAGPAFGSVAPNTGFNFGVPNLPATGGFNFGLAQANTGSSAFAFAPSGAVTPAFGTSTTPAANAPTPPTGGFNFGPPPANNNIGSQGMFNFGGVGTVIPQGNAMFTAGAGGDSSNSGMGQRKFKRGVRRTNKR